jgi:hypothetical protein
MRTHGLGPIVAVNIPPGSHKPAADFDRVKA